MVVGGLIKRKYEQKLTKIKICGFTNAQNAKSAATLGIDAIGLVFYEQSPRNVSAQQAREIINCLPPFINKVGLFVNSTQEYIENILTHVAIDTLQFHGSETAQDCEKYNLPYIKAIAMDESVNLTQKQDEYQSSSGLLLDTPSKYFGGTGKSFDWSLVQKIEKPLILAGGLHPENVAQAIEMVQPYAVDVSSGVESTKGIKDLVKIKDFLQQVKGGSYAI